ncbi:MAG: hypothetical protein EOM13_01490 [Clostridia bacterium]|nr:hypothetical protein [Clostridia bacterium]
MLVIDGADMNQKIDLFDVSSGSLLANPSAMRLIFSLDGLDIVVALSAVEPVRSDSEPVQSDRADRKRTLEVYLIGDSDDFLASEVRCALVCDYRFDSRDCLKESRHLLAQAEFWNRSTLNRPGRVLQTIRHIMKAILMLSELSLDQQLASHYEIEVQDDQGYWQEEFEIWDLLAWAENEDAAFEAVFEDDDAEALDIDDDEQTFNGD